MSYTIGRGSFSKVVLVRKKEHPHGNRAAPFFFKSETVSLSLSLSLSLRTHERVCCREVVSGRASRLCGKARV